MKLPKDYDLYAHNKQIDNLNIIAASLAFDYCKDTFVKDICDSNLINLRKLSDIIMHLQLVCEEVLKVPGVSDE